MRTYRAYTNEDVITHAKDVKSVAGLLKKLGLKTAGGNYANIKRLVQKLGIDTSHWTGMAWNKNEQLKDWSEYTKVCHLKVHLIKHKGHKCERCKRVKWLGVPIPLEVHHKNGNRTDNTLDNLEILCNNCHGLTDNWRKAKTAS